VRRRDVLVGLAVLPVGTHALARAGGTPPRVGFLGFASEYADRPTLDAFRRGLQEQDLVEGRTILMEARHAGGDLSLATRIIEELVRKPVDVFVAPGPAAARSIRRATNIPIVAIGLPLNGDRDLFASLAKPGGTVTGFSTFGEELSTKRIEILREVLPGTRLVGILHNMADPVFRDWGVQTEASAREQGLQPRRLGLSSGEPNEVGALLRSLRAQGGEAVIVIRDFLTATLKDEIMRTSAELGISIVAEQASFPQAGALMSYGPDIPDLFRRAAGYVARIIRGDKPGDLPIQLPTKFEFVINLRTAQRLDIPISPALLAQVDQVIE